MKTTGKLLIIATIAFVSGLNINAQNTKSLRVNHNKVQFSAYFSKKTTVIRNLLNDELKSLEAIVRFKPAVMGDEQFTSEMMVDFATISKELESSVKYTPSKIEFVNQENTSVSEDFQEILTELETMVKFKPSKSLGSEDMELKQAMIELEKIVRFTPSATI